MVITVGGILIRTTLKEVSIVGRNTQGVKIIRIKDHEAVSSITVVKSFGDEEEEELDENETTDVVEEENEVSEETNVEEGNEE